MDPIACDAQMMSGENPVGDRVPVHLTLSPGIGTLDIGVDRHVKWKVDGPAQVDGIGFYRGDELLARSTLSHAAVANTGDGVDLWPTPMWAVA